jgi:hypothetical protein
VASTYVKGSSSLDRSEKGEGKPLSKPLGLLELSLIPLLFSKEAL